MPTTGILYRYVSKGNQILDQTKSGTPRSKDDDTYSDVIKSGLGLLERASINPLMKELEQNYSEPETVDTSIGTNHMKDESKIKTIFQDDNFDYST